MIRKVEFNYQVSILLIFGIILFYVGFIDRGKISREKIKIVKGTLKTYRFDNLGKQRYDYMICLNESSEAFKITAALVDQFDKKGFEERIKKYDALELTYFKVKRLIFPDRNVLLSIKDKNSNFLSFENSYQRMKNDNAFWKVISLFILIVGTTIFIVQRTREKVTANNC